jgi:hypothetical protein
MATQLSPPPPATSKVAIPEREPVGESRALALPAPPRPCEEGAVFWGDAWALRILLACLVLQAVLIAADLVFGIGGR